MEILKREINQAIINITKDFVEACKKAEETGEGIDTLSIIQNQPVHNAKIDEAFTMAKTRLVQKKKKGIFG